MKIYVASSWRNQQQQSVVATLRAAGHEVYDFKNPPNNSGFGWEQTEEMAPPWSAIKTEQVLDHPIAKSGFRSDYDAMQWADACVMVQPCGRSAALELGWFAGRGKLSIALLADNQEPELMLKMAHLCTSMEQVLRTLVLLAPYTAAARAEQGAGARVASATDPIMQAFEADLQRIELPAESAAIWIKHRANIAALATAHKERAWKAICDRTEAIGRLKNARVWLKRAISEEDARRVTNEQLADGQDDGVTS